MRILDLWLQSLSVYWLTDGIKLIETIAPYPLPQALDLSPSCASSTSDNALLKIFQYFAASSAFSHFHVLQNLARINPVQSIGKPYFIFSPVGFQERTCPSIRSSSIRLTWSHHRSRFCFIAYLFSFTQFFFSSITSSFLKLFASPSLVLISVSQLKLFFTITLPII